MAVNPSSSPHRVTPGVKRANGRASPANTQEVTSHLLCYLAKDVRQGPRKEEKRAEVEGGAVHDGCLSRAGDQVVDPGWLAGLSQDGQELTTLPVNKLRRHHPATANREA